LITFLYFGCSVARSDSVKNAKDSNADAASGATMEVQPGRLAQTHATNPRVKDFGAMMVKDHGEAFR